MYDSRNDTHAHKELVSRIIYNYIVPSLNERAMNHDNSKLESPEKECYDKYIPILKTAKYGTKEYEDVRKKMSDEGLEHHYSANRHHPEHFKNGINDMTIIDLVEMIADWIAASQRSDTDFLTGLDSNAKKFGLPPMLKDIIANTYRDMK